MIELYHRAAKLGHHPAHYYFASFYHDGDIIEKDMKKATYHLQSAATGGHVIARHNLGCKEYSTGNMQHAYTHFMIAANAGYDKLTKDVREGYKRGFVTKDNLLNTICAYGNSVDIMKSDDRDRFSAQEFVMRMDMHVV